MVLLFCRVLKEKKKLGELILGEEEKHNLLTVHIANNKIAPSFHNASARAITCT